MYDLVGPWEIAPIVPTHAPSLISRKKSANVLLTSLVAYLIEHICNAVIILYIIYNIIRKYT